MRHLHVDIETFSSVDLKKSGLYKYAQSPDFQILLLAYAFRGEQPRIIDFMTGHYEDEWSYVKSLICNPEIVKHAYNAPFEWYCIDGSPLEQWRCTMLHGLYCGYTAGLDATTKALGLPEDKQKLTVGRTLIRTFCVPQKPSKANGNRTRTLPHHEPERWELFKKYCCGDVVAEMAVEEKLAAFPVPDKEQRLWMIDQMVNVRGIAADEKLINGAIYCSETVNTVLKTEAQGISGLDNPNSAVQLSGWLSENGIQAENMQKATIKELVGTVDDPKVKRLLEIRQELAKTSVKKYYAMQDALCADGRLRGLLQFYGANRTGRWAGRLVQVQNLPRNYLETLSHARECVIAKKLEALKLIYGNIPDTLSQLIRTALIASGGKVLAVADYSAIEARVIAWVANEHWRMEVFATHGKIYEASASQMFGVPLEKIVKGNPEYDLRQKGKVAELALGYQGGSGALVAMGALDMGLMEEELPEIVRLWRASNKRIVALWYAVERAAIEVLETGRPVGVRNILLAREYDLNTGMDFFTITLPSGRKLYYAKPFLAPNRWGNPSMHYYGMDQETKKWGIQEIYGGKFVENIVQAIARDCLAVAIERLYGAGYDIVMHVHDEIVAEAEPGAYQKMCDIMGQPIDWADGLLLKAEGFETEFYKKD